MRVLLRSGVTSTGVPGRDLADDALRSATGERIDQEAHAAPTRIYEIVHDISRLLAGAPLPGAITRRY